MSLKEAKQFVVHFVKGDYTPEEYAEFLQWLKGATLVELNEIADEHEALHEQWDVAGLIPAAEWKERIEGKLDRVKEDKEEDKEIPVIGGNRFIRRRAWIAAASVTIVLAGGAIWYGQQYGAKMMGGRPELSAMAKTVENPSGGTEKQLILADGSKVLLNVASTLKYPETFSGTERVVELSGEAYFEVVPDAKKPFRVLIKDAVVNVLGTKFNVRAYADEPVSKTTLIDGLVEMESRLDKRSLKPGEQAVITYPSAGDHLGAGDITTVNGVDVENVLSWKQGYVRFTNEEMQTVMRVLSRYYNVDIQCDQNVATKKTSASVSRDKGYKESISQFEAQGYKFIQVGKIVRVTF